MSKISLLESVRELTKNGTRIWLFDVPPYDAPTETYEYVEGAIVEGIPTIKRTITGTFGQKASMVEADKGYGTYRRWNADHSSYDIRAISASQSRLKQITMAALCIVDTEQFALKCRALFGHVYESYNYSLAPDAEKTWGDLLKAIRSQCHMELLSALVDPELNNKAKLYWDILQKSDGDAFGKVSKVSMDASLKANTTSTMELPSIVPPEGWNL